MSTLPQKPLENQGQFVTVFNGEINQSLELLCNARELHKFLGVQTRFNDWIKNRIKEYGFVKNQDYVLVTENLVTKNENFATKNLVAKNGRGGNRKPITQYHITLDMAKELAMVEKNEQGRKVRRYFIDCEKKAHSLTAQITQTSILLKNIDGNLSQAGRYLAIHGKQTKPSLKSKLSELLAKAQFSLPFIEFGGEK